MKRALILVVAVLLTATIARAQASFGGGAHGGIVFSSFPKEVKDYYGMGFGGGLHADLNIVRWLTLRFNGDYSMIPSDKNKIKNVLAQQFTVGGADADPSQITYEGLNASIISLTINGIGKIPTGSSVTPYGILGAGVHILNLSEQKVSYQGVGDITQELINLGIISQPKGETKFGMNFGAGVEFKLGSLKMFVEGKYVMIFTEGEKTGIIPVTVGLGI